MKAAEYASVIGSVMPIADRPVPDELACLLGWQQPPVLELIAEHVAQVCHSVMIPLPGHSITVTLNPPPSPINAPWAVWGCRGHSHLSGAFYRMKIRLLLGKIWSKMWKMTVSLVQF